MIHTSIDLDRPGKQQGFLQVPYSHDLGGWANVMVPITVVARGTGPTVLCLGGNHGDEYQGQVAIMRLARGVTPSDIVSAVNAQNLILPSGTAKLGELERAVMLNGSPDTRSACGTPSSSAAATLAGGLRNTTMSTGAPAKIVE